MNPSGYLSDLYHLTSSALPYLLTLHRHPNTKVTGTPNTAHRLTKNSHHTHKEQQPAFQPPLPPPLADIATTLLRRRIQESRKNNPSLWFVNETNYDFVDRAHAALTIRDLQQLEQQQPQRLWNQQHRRQHGLHDHGRRLYRLSPHPPRDPRATGVSEAPRAHLCDTGL